MRRVFVLGILLSFFTTLSAFASSTASAAEASACDRAPRDAVAQMCADQSEPMYGVFVTFVYPDASYGAPPPFGIADFYNETEFFTDDAMTRSFGFGLDMTYLGSNTEYQPYWVDYNVGYDFNRIGSPAPASDKKNHTFMAIPSCDNCRTWDIYYDFEVVGTTSSQPNPQSRHLMTGWLLQGMSGQVALSKTSNRIRFLDGNDQFRRFDVADVSTRAPAGDCSPGADPDYCFRFNTEVVTVPGTESDFVSAWDVTKPIVHPGSRTAEPTAPSADAEFDALLARAQRIVDERLGRG